MKILDTDILIAALRGQPVATEFLRDHAADAATTTISEAELYEGVSGSKRPEEGFQAVAKLLAGLRAVPFGPRHARRYGPLAAARHRKGLPGGVFDLLIASIAVEEDAAVVSRSVRDFEGHEGLRVETW